MFTNQFSTTYTAVSFSARGLRPSADLLNVPESTINNLAQPCLSIPVFQKNHYLCVFHKSTTTIRQVIFSLHQYAIPNLKYAFSLATDNATILQKMPCVRIPYVQNHFMVFNQDLYLKSHEHIVFMTSRSMVDYDLLQHSMSFQVLTSSIKKPYIKQALW